MSNHSHSSNFHAELSTIFSNSGTHSLIHWGQVSLLGCEETILADFDGDKEMGGGLDVIMLEPLLSALVSDLVVLVVVDRLLDSKSPSELVGIRR